MLLRNRFPSISRLRAEGKTFLTQLKIQSVDGKVFSFIVLKFSLGFVLLRSSTTPHPPKIFFEGLKLSIFHSLEPKFEVSLEG